MKKIEVAEDLDQVIDAHDSFLEQITTQCLLDPDSQGLVQGLSVDDSLMVVGGGGGSDIISVL